MLLLLCIQLLHFSCCIFALWTFFLWHFSQPTLKWTPKCAVLFSYPGHEVFIFNNYVKVTVWTLAAATNIRHRDDLNRPRRSRRPFQARCGGAALPSSAVMTFTSISGRAHTVCI